MVQKKLSKKRSKFLRNSKKKYSRKYSRKYSKKRYSRKYSRKNLRKTKRIKRKLNKKNKKKVGGMEPDEPDEQSPAVGTADSTDKPAPMNDEIIETNIKKISEILCILYTNIDMIKTNKGKL